jgi:hypothetical protein
MMAQRADGVWVCVPRYFCCEIATISTFRGCAAMLILPDRKFCTQITGGYHLPFERKVCAPAMARSALRGGRVMMMLIFFTVMTDAYFSAWWLPVSPSEQSHFSYPSRHLRAVA